jgi:sugar phosphate isomerase/epimerase
MQISGMKHDKSEKIDYHHHHHERETGVDTVTINSEKNISDFLNLKLKSIDKEIGERLGVQTSKHNNMLLEQQLDFCIKNKGKVFEIFFDGFSPCDLKKDLREKIKKLALENGITLQVHAPIKRGDDSWEKVLKDTLDFCSDTGSKVLTMHPKAKYIPVYENIFREAQEKDIYIGLENYKDNDIYPSPEQFLSLYNHFFNFPNIGITFDVGHANINREAVSYLRSIPVEKIVNMHIHDNSGKDDEHSPVGQGNINFRELIHYLKEKNYQGNFVIERWEDKLESTKKFSSLWNEVN